MGKGKNKLLIALTLIMSVVLIAAICPTASFEADAKSFASNIAWRDDMGNIYIQVYDRHRTSSYAYETIGFTISRCVLGRKEVSPAFEYVTYSFTSPVVESVVEEKDGYITTNFSIKESTFLTDIATYYPDWYADIVSGETCWIVVDSIMRCVQYDSAGNKKVDGWFYDDGTRTGSFRENTYWNVIDTTCQDCGGELPPLQDGYMSSEWGISSTPICAMYHPNRKDGSDKSDVIQVDMEY